MKNPLRSPNTTLVVSGIIGTLSVIHPAYAGVLAVLMAALAPLLPGYIKKTPPDGSVQ